jgi:TonB family protein
MQPYYVLGLDAQITKQDKALATEYYQRAADIAVPDQVFGPAAILSRVALAQLASQAGDETRAAALLQQARAVSSENSYEMAVVLDTSARILRKLGSDADAEKAEAEAKAMRASLASGKTMPPESAFKGVVGGVRAGGFQDGSGTGKPETFYRVGGGVLPPKVLFKLEPDYSQEARALKVQGTVTLQIIVGEDGGVHDVKVLRGVGLGLEQKAVEAIRQWRFAPGTKDGLPVNVIATVEMNFRLL